MKTGWRDIAEPVRVILSNYWKASKWTLTFVALIVILSSAASVAAPYVFSRLINTLTKETGFTTIATGFALYAALLGISDALNKMVGYLSFMSSENLGFGRVQTRVTFSWSELIGDTRLPLFFRNEHRHEFIPFGRGQPFKRCSQGARNCIAVES
jgi:ABC-type multidrug transport system fused ATPase/permease subunit